VAVLSWHTPHSGPASVSLTLAERRPHHLQARCSPRSFPRLGSSQSTTLAGNTGSWQPSHGEQSEQAPTQASSSAPQRRYVTPITQVQGQIRGSIGNRGCGPPWSKALRIPVKFQPLGRYLSHSKGGKLQATSSTGICWWRSRGHP
jgi:hypothetical protein